jgi:hypothetical protein
MLAARGVDSIVKSSIIGRTPAIYWEAVMLLLAGAAWRQYTADQYPPNGRWHAAVYSAAVWAREHTAETDVFAMTDSGDFAFFSCRQVINLDALANNMQYQRAIADRRIDQYQRSKHVRYLVQHAVHRHDDVVQGSYDSLVLNFPSQKFDVLSDDVLVHRQNEAYRSPPYFDGGDRVVLLIWSL